MELDELYIKDVVRDISAQLEDVFHRIYTIEDSIAECNARIIDLQEEKEDVR
jgi:hypothetical protein